MFLIFSFENVPFAPWSLKKKPVVFFDNVVSSPIPSFVRKFCVSYFLKFSFVSNIFSFLLSTFPTQRNTLFSLDKSGNKLSPFRGQNLCLCSLLCKSLIFSDFKNRTNFCTPLQQKTNLFCHLLEETRVSLQKHFFLLLVHVFFCLIIH